MKSRLTYCLLIAVVVSGCSGDPEAPRRPEPPSSAASSTGPSRPGATESATESPAAAAGPDDVAAQEERLRARIALPPLPSFSLPTDLLTSAADRSIAQALDVEPGLYRGIAVVDARCGRDGTARGADTGTVLTGSAAAGHYEDATHDITIAADGTGVYNGPDLHVAVLPAGAGVYDDGTTRVTVSADGSGVYRSGDRRFSVRADGSGSYSDGEMRLWVGEDGSGGYEDSTTTVRLHPDGRTSAEGDEARGAAAAAIIDSGLPLFPPVPRVVRVRSAGSSCGTIIRLDANVLFDTDSAELRGESQAVIARVARLLRALGHPQVLVDGHTDQRGATDYNLALSKARAAAVTDAIVGAGVRSQSLESRGWGESRPMRSEAASEPSDVEAARQLNRRVELVLNGS